MNEQPETNFEITVVAALLHDIGILAQRAADPQRPVADHAPLVASFVAAHGPALWRSASSAILAHHRPDDRASRLVAAADQLAAGGPDDEESARPLWQRESPLTRVELGSTRPADRPALFLPVAAGGVDLQAIVPVSPRPRDEVRRRLDELTELFAVEHRIAASGDFRSYVEGLLDLVIRVGWAIPSPAKEGPNDISLADHLKVASAVVACLVRDNASDDDLTAILAGDSAALAAPRALLVKGDLSGIRPFVAAGGAAAAIRGRSFYCDELARAVADWILRRLDLPPTCRLYVGDGHFVLLAPLAAADALGEARREVERRLLRGHDGDLGLALASVIISGAEIGGDGGPAWARLQAALHQEKDRRFADLSIGEQIELFRARNQVGRRLCDHCGREGADESGLCPFCASVAALGADLASARYLLVADIADQPNPADTGAGATLALFGRRVIPFSSIEEPPTVTGAERIRLERIGALGPITDAERAWAEHQTVPRSVVSRLLSTHQPDSTDLDQVLESGARLGVLRADVDSLGRVFNEGLRPGGSLARAAGVSWLLRLFFEGTVGQLVQRHAAGAAAVLSSGGDDVVVVGAWARLPQIAFRIREAFDWLTGQNPDLHFSAGIVALPAPAGLGASLSAAALSSAKAHSAGKNAIDFLGAGLSWREFPELLRRYDRFRSLVQRRGVSADLLRIFLEAGDAGAIDPESPAGRRRLRYGPWLWRASYQLRRLGEGPEASRIPENDVIEFRQDLANGERLSKAILAARWIEQETRTPSRKEAR